MTESEAVRVVKFAAWARSIVFVVASAVCLIQFAAYLPGFPEGSTSPGLALLDRIPGGLQTWAVLFGLAGLAGLVAAGAGSRSRWLIVVQGMLFGAWGSTHMLSWFIEGGRGWVAAAPWMLCDFLALALLLLPARRR